MEVWAVEGVTHCILRFMALSTFDAVLHFIQAIPELQGYLQDGSLWSKLSVLHFKAQRDLELRFLALPTRDRGWDWTDRRRTCVELQEFLQSKD
ncbi:hypothetical protein PF011_g27205, partial [Phytophthora fragariae]